VNCQRIDDVNALLASSLQPSAAWRSRVATCKFDHDRERNFIGSNDGQAGGSMLSYTPQKIQ
jgi:hypothetical protein